MARLDRTANVVLATDFSAGADAAAEAARKYAVALGARLHVLHVSSLGPNDALLRAMSALAERLEGIPVVLVLDKGCPATRILAYAGEVGAELIVLGAHGRHGSPAAPLGSVAEEVSRRAPCPVLTVRGDSVPVARDAPALHA